MFGSSGITMGPVLIPSLCKGEVRRGYCPKEFRNSPSPPLNLKRGVTPIKMSEEP
jgi:hypothetical protein